MPVLTLFNLISQLWVENEVAAMMEEMQMGQMPLAAMLFSMSICAPFFEEITCRGRLLPRVQKVGRRCRGDAVVVSYFRRVAHEF